VRWGVLGTAMIALNRVIPAMQAVSIINVAAIASRDYKSAQEAAAKVGIEKAYGSYEGLLADPSIDAVYIPVCTENLNPDVVVMKPAKDRV
jgi:predicted dehydrogenase